MANQRTILILKCLSITVMYTRALCSWNYYFFKKDSFATKKIIAFVLYLLMIMHFSIKITTNTSIFVSNLCIDYVTLSILKFMNTMCVFFSFYIFIVFCIIPLKYNIYNPLYTLFP